MDQSQIVEKRKDQIVEKRKDQIVKRKKVTIAKRKPQHRHQQQNYFRLRKHYQQSH
jgi:hypothetical protein